VRQPTLGVAVSTTRMARFGAEIGYRRTWSQTVGLIDEPDRFANPDLGLYPDESGQAPASGVNEERFYARAHGRFTAGAVGVSPFANARFSLLHAALDRFDAGLELRYGQHVLEPAVEYFLPTFDGDSIFNVFSIEPTSDVRLGYRYTGDLELHALGWLRRYHAGGDLAGGVDAGVSKMLAQRWRARVDALYDDGYGGRRVGGSGEIAWRARRDLWLRGRAIVLGVARDDRSDYVTTSAVLSSSHAFSDSVAIHLVGELDRDEIHSFQGRAFAILDLAFLPEP